MLITLIARDYFPLQANYVSEVQRLTAWIIREHAGRYGQAHVKIN